MFQRGVLLRILSLSSMGYPTTASDMYPVTRSTGYPTIISAGYSVTTSDKHLDTTSAKVSHFYIQLSTPLLYPAKVSRFYIQLIAPLLHSAKYPRFYIQPGQGRGSRNDNPVPIPPPVTATVPLPRDPIRQEINWDVLKQQAAAYVEFIRLRMIAQAIPFKVAGIAGEIGWIFRYQYLTDWDNLYQPRFARLISDPDWKLPPGSVDSFSKLTTAFCAQFQGIKPRPKDPILLQETIYFAIRDKGLLWKPGPMKVPADRRNKYKYCDFHEDVRHNTLECYSLRYQIEGLNNLLRRHEVLCLSFLSKGRVSLITRKLGSLRHDLFSVPVQGRLKIKWRRQSRGHLIAASYPSLGIPSPHVDVGTGLSRYPGSVDSARPLLWQLAYHLQML
ncbi:hypothetical protein LWI28_025081 [Acer negundo]|uniref:Uncharacterized protein n=1 Tax=Acer negundo TaxID=4023 RepID=A0AAD5IJK2_ACENE|nr:hypothetical protein LWI28_025081 [Acer negundo]